MTMRVQRRDGLYRIVTSGRLALDAFGGPLDGGGFRRKARAHSTMKQAIRYEAIAVKWRRRAQRPDGINKTISAMAATHGFVVTHVDRDTGTITMLERQ